MAVSRAVRLLKCPLGQLTLYNMADMALQFITCKLRIFSKLRSCVLTEARFRRRYPHVPKLTDELGTAKERRLNQFGMVILVWCSKTLSSTESVGLLSNLPQANLGLTHGAPSA